MQRGSTLGMTAACIISGLPVVGAVVLSHTQREREAALCLAWMGAGYGAIAGLMLTHDATNAGTVMASTGAGALIAGGVALFGLTDGRALTQRGRPPGGGQVGKY